ncbi:choice-of-anchor Q domain-containing protein [Pontiellaceae bacterium B12227]|nr:choice-of-anchor Q domain-containing protein [Pontiellaceae bacterium B12227]
MKTTALGLSLFLLASSTMAATFYVSPTGSDTPPYSSWGTAANRIQTAVDAASDGDTVMVYEGIYNLGHTVTPGYSSFNRVVITKDIRVQSWGLTENTIIAGNNVSLGRNDVLVRCVYMTKGELDGFTLQKGYANDATGDAIYDQSGGAICAGSNLPKIKNCDIKDSIAINFGGGAYKGIFTDCTFSGNRAASYGGGSFLGSFTNCTFTSNVALSAGGSSHGILTNCTFVDNFATNFGGGSYEGDLTGCSFSNNSASFGAGSAFGTLSNCTYTANVATASGGGTYYGTLTDCSLTANAATNYGGGSYWAILTNCYLTLNTASKGAGVYKSTLTLCELKNNTAAYGGGCHTSTLVDCLISGNTASIYGGGCHSSALTNCIIESNTAVDGGGTYAGTLHNSMLSDNTASSTGGGSREGTLTGCTLMDNTAESGGGSYNSALRQCIVSGNAANNGGGCAEYASTNTLQNCIITGNSATLGGGSYDCTLYHCTVKGNLASSNGGGCYAGSLFNTIIVGNIAQSHGDDLYSSPTTIACCSPDLTSGGTTNAPLFADALLHLRPDSPCIDAGVMQSPPILTDFHGLPRPLDGDANPGAYVDMGAYEFAGAADYDDDGLTDAEEVALGSDLDNDDTDGDGRQDGDEVAMGFSPTYNEGAALYAGAASVIADPAAYGLYTADSIQDLNMGALMVQAEGGTLHLSLQMKQTTNLASNVWNDAGEAVEWEMQATNGATFFRVHAE